MYRRVYAGALICGEIQQDAKTKLYTIAVDGARARRSTLKRKLYRRKLLTKVNERPAFNLSFAGHEGDIIEVFIARKNKTL